MKVYLLDHTKYAKELLIFSKRTRHMVGVASLGEVMEMSEEEKEEQINYVFNTIGSSWEFVHYTFLITEVTRAFTHQLVRHRVGVAFAQQAQRVGTQKDFNYMIPKEIEKNKRLYSIYQESMELTNSCYKELIDNSARPQDARGILPTNIHTNILMKINLRALSDMLLVRLCVRAQGEFQDVAREMRDLVIQEHPWAKKVLGVHCVRLGVCKFPMFKDCPIKKRYPFLRGFTEDLRDEMERRWENTLCDPQPTKDSWTKGE